MPMEIRYLVPKMIINLCGFTIMYHEESLIMQVVLLLLPDNQVIHIKPLTQSLKQKIVMAQHIQL